MTEPTAGTWVPGYYRPTFQFWMIEEHRCVMQEETGTMIALCGPSPTDDLTEADVHLLSAAKELLAACEEADRYLLQFRGSPLLTEEAQIRRQAAKRVSDLLRAAIAKARPEGV